MKRPSQSPVKKFFRYHTVDESTGCWHWTGTLTLDGRPVMVYGNTEIMATSFIYLKYFGKQYYHRDLTTTCNTPNCVNPHHLKVSDRIKEKK